MTKILYLDLVGGVAGDMLMAALIDAGASILEIREAIKRVGLDDVSVETKTSYPAGIRALQVDVMVRGRLADNSVGENADTSHVQHRHYGSIKSQIEDSELASEVKKIALDTFARLAEAESKAHGVPVDKVEFHEVGSDDAIADIVGTAAAFVSLNIETLVVSPLPMGRGMTRGAHGPIPLPAPATLSLLLGAPIIETNLEGETVTPTGAALIMTLVNRFGAMPTMLLRKVGVGAGHRDWPDRPNVVRAMIGDSENVQILTSDDDVILETNIDDMTAEQLASLQERIQSGGAIDAWSTPVYGKKGRIGQKLSALVSRNLVEQVSKIFFTHSTTLGLREYSVRRHRTDRKIVTVSTAFGVVRIKISERSDGSILTKPEHQDCEKRALQNDVSVRVVYEAAQQAYKA